MFSISLSFVREQRGKAVVNVSDFYEILYLIISRKVIEKIQILLKSAKKKWYFTSRCFYIYDTISLNFSQNDKYFRQKL